LLFPTQIGCSATGLDRGRRPSDRYGKLAGRHKPAAAWHVNTVAEEPAAGRWCDDFALLRTTVAANEIEAQQFVVAVHER
jgi:hypothetical protein